MPSIENSCQLTADPRTRSGSSVSENVRLRLLTPTSVATARHSVW